LHSNGKEATAACVPYSVASYLYTVQSAMYIDYFAQIFRTSCSLIF